MRALLPLAILGFSCVVNLVSAQDSASPSPVVADILKLSQAKVDEGVIVAYLQGAPRENIAAADLVQLHSNGVSSRVLVALLNSHPPTDAAQSPAQTEVSSPVSNQSAVEAASFPAVVEAPLVDYVSAPVYVGGGSVYYQDDGWWGVGLGLGLGFGYCGWSSWYPWCGFGGYRSYYGCSRSYVHWGSRHDGHGGHWAGHPQRVGGGGRSSGVGRSTFAGAGAHPGSGLAASPGGRSVSGGATARPPVGGNRAGANTGNVSSRNPGNAVAGGRGAATPVGNPVRRSSTTAAIGRATVAGVGPNSGARPVGTASGGVNRPVAVTGAGQQSPTLAGRGFVSPTPSVSTPRYAGNSTMHPVYPGGGQRSTGNYASGFGGGQVTARSFSAPSSMGSYSAGRSFSGGSHPGGFSGGGARGFSGGGGGVRGGSSGGGRR